MTTSHRRFLILEAALCFCVLPQVATANTAEEITAAMLAPNDDNNRPLPVAASWNASTWWNWNLPSRGFSPGWVEQKVMEGHHVMISALMPVLHPSDSFPASYLEDAMKCFRRQHLPVVFLGTQWEHLLYDEPKFFGLPSEQNPNVVTADGSVLKSISPFGPVEHWQEVGRTWGAAALMTLVQTQYPDPPLVIFLSNNEANKLSWTEAEKDRRYLALYGAGRPDEFKMKVVGDGYIERYRALQQGFREGLASEKWRAVARFHGYDATPARHLGRWGGWKQYSMYSPKRIDANPLMWDGTSDTSYLYNAPTDCTVNSVQVESSNLAFLTAEARKLNPSYWFEQAPWDNCLHNDPAHGYCGALAARGENLTDARYTGAVQFNLWMTTPRSVREYRNGEEPLAPNATRFMAIVGAVDRVWTNPVLKEFWKHGQLVGNGVHPHPFNESIPAEIAGAERNFLLSTNKDSPRPWNLSTEIPVYALARVIGTASQRKWLVYAHSPVRDYQSVSVTLPGYGSITIETKVTGSFYLVDEAAHTVKRVVE